MAEPDLDFLTPAWLGALAEQVAVIPTGIATPFVLTLRIEGTPPGALGGYALAFAPDGVAVRAPGPDVTSDDADLSVTLPWPVAIAIARGTDNAQHALARGALRIGGRPETAAPVSAALLALGDALAALRARTRFAGVS